MMRHYPISSMYVEDLTCDDIQRHINKLVSDGFSHSTIKKQHDLITAYLKHAMSKGVITIPIYMTVEMPKDENIAKPKKEMITYNQIEQMALMKVLDSLEHNAYAVAILMLETGMRIGEALCISWSDVQWERKAVIISKTLVKLSSNGSNCKTFVQYSPKSTTSKRTIPLSNKALDILHRLAQSTKSFSGYIFHREDDNDMPFSYETTRYYIRQACRAAKVQYRGNHIFRHTFATNCYYRGCDVKILSKLLGHANVGITYNTYIHLYGDALEEMRKVVG